MYSEFCDINWGGFRQPENSGLEATTSFQNYSVWSILFRIILLKFFYLILWYLHQCSLSVLKAMSLKTVMPGQEYFKNLDSDKICFINQLQQIMKQYRFPSLEVIRSGDNFPEFQKKKIALSWQTTKMNIVKSHSLVFLCIEEISFDRNNDLNFSTHRGNLL